jgi:hypothetical protein
VNNRTALTKSLHTASVLVAVARQLPAGTSDAPAVKVRRALHWLGMQDNWPDTDPVFAAAVAKLAKGVQS